MLVAGIAAHILIASALPRALRIFANLSFAHQPLKGSVYGGSANMLPYTLKVKKQTVHREMAV